jgi:hypothetical protein
MPTISVDPERLFSVAKIIILDRRTCLGIYTIKALEYLKSRLKIKAFINDNKENILL